MNGDPFQNFDFEVALLSSEAGPLPGKKTPQISRGCAGLQLLADLAELDILCQRLDTYLLAKITIRSRGYALPRCTWLQLGTGRFSDPANVSGALMRLFCSQEDRAVADLQENGTASRTWYYDTLFLKEKQKPEIKKLISDHLSRKDEYRRFCTALSQCERRARQAGLIVSRSEGRAFISLDLSEAAVQGLSLQEFASKAERCGYALSQFGGQAVCQGDFTVCFSVPRGMLPFAHQLFTEKLSGDLEGAALGFSSTLEEYRSCPARRAEDLRLQSRTDLERQMSESAGRAVLEREPLNQQIRPPRAGSRSGAC